MSFFCTHARTWVAGPEDACILQRFASSKLLGVSDMTMPWIKSLRILLTCGCASALCNTFQNLVELLQLFHLSLPDFRGYLTLCLERRQALKISRGGAAFCKNVWKIVSGLSVSLDGMYSRSHEFTLSMSCRLQF